MSTDVINPEEVLLNAVRYPLVGQLKPRLSSLFAQKQVIGAFTKASDPRKDAWVVVGDSRGGVLQEEMDEENHPDMYWWGSANTRLKGHLFLGELATQVTNHPFKETSPTGTTDAGAAWTGDANAIDNNTATYATTTVGTTAKSGYLQFDIASTDIKGIEIRCGRQHSDLDQLEIDVYDGSWHVVFSGNPGLTDYRMAWSAVYTGVTAARVRMGQSGGTINREGYIHELWFLTSGTITITNHSWCNFNNELYVSVNAVIAKLNATGDGFTVVGAAITNVTDMIASLNSCMYIASGASVYCYMSTAEAFTTTNIVGLYYWVEWDAKLFGIYNDGTIAYATTPNSATPSWTNNGRITQIPAGSVKSLRVSRDAAGDDIIYAGTNLGWWAHDYTNAKWYQAVQVPTHPNGGKGLLDWNGAMYYTAGLNVKQYIADSSPAVVAEVGLDKIDGLPAEYNGEIVKLIDGFGEMYALVDASQSTGTGYSTIMAWDGKAWYCKWESGTADKAFHSGIVSSEFAYRLWFDWNDGIYYIPLERSIQNPLKVSTKTYATSGIFISSWFDGGWEIGNKLAAKLLINVGKNVSVDETVVVKYRTNHTNTDRDTGWTTLGTITSSGETAYTFGSSLGEAFKAIQFRLDFARAGASTTETADVFYMVLEYRKVLPKTWGWTFTVDCSKEYARKTPDQLITALETAAALETMVSLNYRATTKYVVIESIEGERMTGMTPKGNFTVTVTEL